MRDLERLPAQRESTQASLAATERDWRQESDEVARALQLYDGVTWSALDSGITADLRSLTWTGKRLVAVAADGKVLTSEDGTSWIERGANLEKRMRQVAWTGKFLSAVGERGYNTISSDGTSWTMQENDKINLLVPTGAVGS